MTDLHTQLGVLLRAHRSARGWSLVKLCGETGRFGTPCTPSAVSEIERGERYASGETLEKIMLAMGLDWESLAMVE